MKTKTHSHINPSKEIKKLTKQCMLLTHSHIKVIRYLDHNRIMQIKYDLIDKRKNLIKSTSVKNNIREGEQIYFIYK